MAAVCTLFLACGSQFTGPDAIPASQAGPEVAQFVEAMNAHRRSTGCGDLVWHDVAAAVAEAHSRDMTRRDFFSHTNPDGASPFDRLAAAGVTYRSAGENIALTSGGPSSALQLWLGSSGHRANIERCEYTHHGVGLDGVHWTHVFLRDPATSS